MGSSGDPNTRRLRRFLLLVVLAVALPSLALSGFGLIAISNERDAAAQRLMELYKPVLIKLAGRIKETLRQVRDEADTFLSDLLRLGQGGGTEPGPSLSRFMRERALGANFFVIDPQGRLRFPRPDLPAATPVGSLPPIFEDAEEQEFARRDPAGAAGQYAALVAGLAAGDPLRCPPLQARARALETAGQSAAAREALGAVVAECSRFVDEAGYLPGFGARLRLLELARPGSEDQDRLALELARALSDPAAPLSSGLLRFFAHSGERALGPAEDEPLEAPDRASARDLLRSLSTADELIAAVSDQIRELGTGAELRSVAVDKIRRMLVLRREAGWLVGVELSPAAMAPIVRAFLEDLELAESVRGVLVSSTRQWEDCCEGREVGGLLLTDGDFGWRLELLMTGTDPVDELTRRRTQLYLWALVLLVLALSLGIGATVWTMVRETRLSRLKTDFVSNVSHELRTPLTSIRMFTETLLLGRVRTEDERNEALQIIADESERLSRMVSRILDFSRMEAGRKAYRFQREALIDLVQAAMRACRPLIEEKGFEVEVRLAPNLPPVQADRDAMVEVFLNLLSNAIKYSPAHRRVTIEGRADEDWVELAVVDQGIGIPRSEQKRIFDKFYRVPHPLASEVSGSGLGLSLVQYIVRAHGGEVAVESTPGRGSRFSVRLPRHREVA